MRCAGLSDGETRVVSTSTTGPTTTPHSFRLRVVGVQYNESQN
jgi:hypothetical protein